MRVDRGHFFSALAGLVAGALLIGALPGLAATGDVAKMGQWNRAGKQTVFSSAAGTTLQVRNTKSTGIPLRLIGDPGMPPMAVNSDVMVENLNADLLDDRSVDQLRNLWRGCSYVSSDENWSCSETITVPDPGVLLLSGSVDLYNLGSTGDRVWCWFAIDDVYVEVSDRDITVGADEYATCATDIWKQVPAGTYVVDFRLSDVAATTAPGQGAFWVLAVPD